MDIVQGFIYDNEYDPKHHGRVCKIVARADPDPARDQGIWPTFRIRFGDGCEQVTTNLNLRPWYPTD